MDAGMSGCLDAWVGGWVGSGWEDGWMDGRTDGWMDRWREGGTLCVCMHIYINMFIHVCIYIYTLHLRAFILQPICVSKARGLSQRRSAACRGRGGPDLCMKGAFEVHVEV